MIAKVLIAILEKNPELELGRVSFVTSVKIDKDRHAFTSGFIKMFGEFRKVNIGNEIYLKHSQDDLDCTIFNYDRCHIVGKRLEKRQVPIAFEETMVEIPVSDCEIQRGDVSKDEVIYNDKAVAI